MKKNNRSLTKATGTNSIRQQQAGTKRRRYQTLARRQAKQEREGFYLKQQARANLAENLKKMLTISESAGLPDGIAKKINHAALILKLEQAWSIGASDTEAAYHAGISPARLCQIKQELPELAEHAEALRSRPITTARHTIVKNLRKPRWSAWYLERKVPAEFAQQNKVEHSGEMLFSHFAGKQGSYDKARPALEAKEKDDK